MRPCQLLGLPLSHAQVNGPYGRMQLAADAAFRHLAGGLDGTNVLKVSKMPFVTNFGNKMDMEWTLPLLY